MDRPIGIFDSGIGGLTVAKAIADKLPNETLIYFGDTAHLPYGDKSKESIITYSKKIAKFLKKKKCKIIVIACNTASAYAYNVLKKEFPKTPIINVIDPTVKYCANHYDKGKIGVIATKGTITSRVYPNRIQRKNKNLKVHQAATPLLAPMIEEGFYNNNISRTIINSYLSANQFDNIKALILACTHYPLIKPEVEEYFKEEVDVIDSASVVADFIDHLLEKKKLKSEKRSAPNHFFVSDYTKSFEETSKRFFGEKLRLEEYRIWD